VLDQQLRDQLHEQLLMQRQRLEQEISNLTSSGIRGDTFNDDEMTDVVDQHPADEGSELFEREKNLTLQRTLGGSLQNVNEALHKFDNGTYGICERCGNEIPEKRLRALPEATHCVECQAILDRQRTRAHV
jgi:RNA polymerase-binding protein DksA